MFWIDFMDVMYFCVYKWFNRIFDLKKCYFVVFGDEEEWVFFNIGCEFVFCLLCFNCNDLLIYFFENCFDFGKFFVVNDFDCSFLGYEKFEM